MVVAMGTVSDLDFNCFVGSFLCNPIQAVEVKL